MSQCWEGYPNNDCNTKQNFCSIKGQSVENNDINRLLYNNTNFNKVISNSNDQELETVIASSTEIQESLWNRIYTVLKNIHLYGIHGAKNPLNIRVVKGKLVSRGDGKAYGYQNEKGIMVANTWLYYEGNYYYIGESEGTDIGGGLYSEWKQIGDYYYYFDNKGAMARDCWRYDPKTKKNCYVDKGGVWIEDYEDGDQITHHLLPPTLQNKANTSLIVDSNFNLTDVKENDTIIIELYNIVTKALNKSQKAKDYKTFITKNILDTLQTYINNYQLNDDRCNSCNTSCNASCQISAQGGGGGGSGGGGCDACMCGFMYATTGNGGCYADDGNVIDTGEGCAQGGCSQMCTQGGVKR